MMPQAAIEMDNSGDGPIQVPGFNKFAYNYHLPLEDRFVGPEDIWMQTPAVTAREYAMVAVMNSITDKQDWHLKLHDDVVLAEWYQEVSANSPLISDRAWSWCVAELRDKAQTFTQDQFVRVLDTGTCVCKADTLISEACRQDLKQSLTALFNQHKGRQESEILDVVDPSLHLLVYGESPVLSRGGKVELHKVLDSFDHALLAPDLERKKLDGSWQWCSSSKFQWLPCDVKFAHKTGTDVEITSYVNNLHPDNLTTYRCLEDLLSHSVGMWNACLIQGWHRRHPSHLIRQRGPVPLRIVTYGAEWVHRLPAWASAFDPSPDAERRTMLDCRETRIFKLRARRDRLDREQTSLPIRENAEGALSGAITDSAQLKSKRRIENQITPETLQKVEEYLNLSDLLPGTASPLPADWRDRIWDLLQAKAERISHWKHPEPGDAVSYDSWKSGDQNHRPVVMPITELPTGMAKCSDEPIAAIHEPCPIHLEDQFREKGLQTIIKISGVELGVTNPRHVDNDWHAPVQMNNHIVATAMYAIGASNVTDCRIRFRQVINLQHYFQDIDNDDFSLSSSVPRHLLAGEDDKAITSLLGFEPGELNHRESRNGRPKMCSSQVTGSVVMPEGRLITFPNVMEFQFEPFELLDPSRPGHCRWIIIHLVDPHYRICSTRNVPPQQHHWWSKAASELLAHKGLPQELCDMITQNYQDFPMGFERAVEHRKSYEGLDGDLNDAFQTRHSIYMSRAL